MREKILINTILLNYLDEKIIPSNRTPLTIKKYQAYVNILLRHFDGREVGTIKPSDVQIAFNEICKTTGKDYAGRVVSLLRKAIAYAQADGVEIKDFTVGLELFAKHEKKKRADKFLHSEQDIQKFMRAIKRRFNYEDSVVAYFVYLLFLTGWRPGELLACRWSDVDFENERVKTYSRINSVTLERTKPKNEDSIRTTPLNKEAVEIFAELKELQKQMLKDHQMSNKDDYVFLHWSCKHLLPTNTTLNQFVRRINAETKIKPELTLYGARHCRLCLLLMHGVDIAVVAKYAGHNDNTQLLKTYGGLLQEAEDEGFNQIRQI